MAKDREGDGQEPAHHPAIAFAVATVLGLLLFTYRYLGAVADGESKPVLEPLIEELTAAYSAGLLFFVVRFVARRFPLNAPGGYRHLPAHALAMTAMGATMTSMMWCLRSLIFPLAGLGGYDYGRMPHRYFMEFPVQVIIYGLMTLGVYVADHYRATRERTLRAAQLETQLSRAQLQSLELQLQPHFLFNALNTISSTMYDDPAAADEMLSHLADLLRASLGAQRGQEVPLRQELETLGHYLSLVHARFGDRLRVRLTVDLSARELLVPSLLLQPLVENAVRHGRASTDGAGQIEVKARREGETLRLEVSDDGGEAAGAGEKGSGLGLALTRERLRLLYGEAHEFRAEALNPGGFVVQIALPARTARTHFAASELGGSAIQ